MSDSSSRPRDVERLRRNRESAEYAHRRNEQWDEFDDEFLVLFWIQTGPQCRNEAEVAKTLGRTIEGCRVRCEEIRKRLGISDYAPSRKEKPVIGWIINTCDGCGRYTDVFSNGQRNLCEDCR